MVTNKIRIVFDNINETNNKNLNNMTINFTIDELENMNNYDLIDLIILLQNELNK